MYLKHSVSEYVNKLSYFATPIWMKLYFNHFLLPEIDECATGTHGCEQICINTMGGYKCDCKLGYELHSDGKKCEGQLSGQCIAHTDQFLRENNNNKKKTQYNNLNTSKQVCRVNITLSCWNCIIIWFYYMCMFLSFILFWYRLVLQKLLLIFHFIYSDIVVTGIMTSMFFSFIKYFI